jgi:hypothetical protein
MTIQQNADNFELPHAAAIQGFERFITSGDPLPAPVMQDLRELSPQERSEIAATALAGIEVEGYEGREARADWLARLGGDNSAGMLQLMAWSEPVSNRNPGNGKLHFEEDAVTGKKYSAGRHSSFEHGISLANPEPQDRISRTSSAGSRH